MIMVETPDDPMLLLYSERPCSSSEPSWTFLDQQQRTVLEPQKIALAVAGVAGTGRKTEQTGHLGGGVCGVIRHDGA